MSTIDELLMLNKSAEIIKNRISSCKSKRKYLLLKDEFDSIKEQIHLIKKEMTHNEA